MCVICDIGQSCLQLSGVTLLKNVERENVANNKHNDQLSNFFFNLQENSA
jgi:hypothetical protein